ncbi:MAG: hypothetical protein B0D92_01845 [Spirochaeta sp. LUC14_002_19_P3]|nr:MAG: hypothetical protein B0D92_01845 [Spirochaeta sp. LUC14_002_19_P3]
MSRICLSLESLEGVERQLESVAADLVEVRVDMLSRGAREAIRPESGSRGRRVPSILVIRCTEDGGRWGADGETEAEREELFQGLLASGHWDWVELEYHRQLPQVIEAAGKAGTRIIFSINDSSGMSLNQPVRELAVLMRNIHAGGAIPKLALQCESSRQLLTLARLALALEDMPEKLLTGRGEYGAASGILAEKFGSLWVYAALNREPYPWHLNDLNDLYRFREIGESTPVYAVTGNPIGHSRSPKLHNGWLRTANIPGCYIPIRSDDVGALLETCDILGITGLSVTVPHKETVLRYCDVLEPLVRRIGAANTLIRGGEGWRAHNTDAGGFMGALLEALEVSGTDALKGRKVLLIGAGGAAKAAVYSLAEAGCRLVILNRTPKKAEALAKAVGGEYGRLGPESEFLCRGVEIAVQTTSVGMAPNLSGDPLPWWNPIGCRLLFDMIYNPAETVLMSRASAAGVKAVNGAGMLVQQAALQFEMFTGFPPG